MTGPAVAPKADLVEMQVSPARPRLREVVAAVLLHGDRICLLKRSLAVAGDQGRWHCVTGYLPPRVDPLHQALAEIAEETGLGTGDLTLLRGGERLDLRCAEGNLWRVTPFLFRAGRSDLRLNWEHDAYQWLRPADVVDMRTVPWLADVLSAVSSNTGALTWGVQRR